MRLLLAALLFVPAAAAHGGVPPREIDSFLLADDEGLYDYGGCVNGDCLPPTEPAGIDLLGLDAREAYLPDGTPCLVLYATFQTDGRDIPDRAIRFSFTAAGEAQTVTVTDPTLRPQTTEAALVTGPDDLGDGHPQAIEVWITYAQMGTSQGDRVTDIRVQSLRTGEPDDEMPGTWYSQGQRVPHVPHSPDPGDLMGPTTPGVRELVGPTRLFRMDQAQYVARVDSVNLTATTVLSQMDQFVTATANFPGVILQPSQFILAAGQSRTIALTATGLQALTNVTVTLQSDLGSREVVAALVAPPPMPAAAAPPEPGKSAPLPWLTPLVAIALAMRLLKRS